MKVVLIGSALLVAIVSGVNLTRLVQRTPAPARGPTRFTTDSVLRQEQRLAGVRAALARHAARDPVGYITDLPPEQWSTDPAATRDYFLSQFVLAPRVLEAKFRDCTWAVANLSNAVPGRVPEGYRVVEDFGRGVLLLRKESQ